MADTKISAMNAATALSGPELVAGVQSSDNVKITATQIKTFTSASPTLVTPVVGAATGTSLVLSAYVKTTGKNVSQLTAAATAGIGARDFVIDASTTVILGLGLTVTGSGANKVPVYCDGTNWIVG